MRWQALKKCWSRFTVKARGILPARNDPKNMVTARRSSHCESADILKTKEARRSKEARKQEGRKEGRSAKSVKIIVNFCISNYVQCTYGSLCFRGQEPEGNSGGNPEGKISLTFFELGLKGGMFTCLVVQTRREGFPNNVAYFEE